MNDISSLVEYEGHEFVLAFHSHEDHIARQVRESLTFYEAELLAAIRPILEPNSLVIDAGANIGNHAVFFAGVCRAKVIAVEPVPETYAYLLRNIADNGLTARVSSVQVALGSSRQQYEIESVDPLNTGATRLTPDPNGSIASSTIDEMVGPDAEPVVLLKVDVEGMELDVLHGAVAVLKRDRPLVVCECAGDSEFESVAAFLLKFGYAPAEAFNATPTFLFLHTGWSGGRSYPRARYFEDATARSSRKAVSLAGRLSRANSMLRLLDERIDSLEGKGRCD